MTQTNDLSGHLRSIAKHSPLFTFDRQILNRAADELDKLTQPQPTQGEQPCQNLK